MEGENFCATSKSSKGCCYFKMEERWKNIYTVCAPSAQKPNMAERENVCRGNLLELECPQLVAGASQRNTGAQR